ncbi:MAG: pseudaminic acid cytidylyltransferase [Rhodospirillales bacterium]|nr:MAG: pseudaminic acid cytidylyltransferase [Rhodospirillales bacterium]
MKAITVIPARGGSKRIPRKNIRPFCGKPMIAWPIEAARAAGCSEAVMVSTDDPEIAEVSRAFGADVPFVRPASLADDHTGTVEVIAHAAAWYIENVAVPDLICCLYATAPFVTPADLQYGRELIAARGAAYAFSVTTFASPIQRALRVTDTGGVEMFAPEHLNTRSQDLEPAYHDAGQFYWGRTEAWLELMALFTPASVPIILPRHRVQDIDTEEDWEIAERLFICSRGLEVNAINA